MSAGAVSLHSALVLIRPRTMALVRLVQMVLVPAMLVLSGARPEEERGGPARRPRFASVSGVHIVKEGRAVVLPCVIQDEGEHIVLWKRETAADVLWKRETAADVLWLTVSSFINVPGDLRLLDGYNLQIEKTRPSDAGVYTCAVPLDGGYLEQTQTLHVRSDPADVTSEPVTKDCFPLHISPVAPGWIEANVVPVPPDPSETDHDRRLMSIRVSNEDWDGLHLCMSYIHEAHNVSTPAEEPEADIGRDRVGRWWQRPVIRPRQTLVFRVLEGQKVELICSGTGEPTPDIWIIDDTAPGEIPSLDGVPGRVTATIAAVQLKHAGLYHCRVGNKAGVIEQRVQLVVVPTAPATPPVIQQPAMAQLWVDEGDEVKFDCSATGDPAPSLQAFGKSRLRQIESVPGRLTGTLSPISSSDTGRYSCRAENYAGVTTAHQDLHVYHYTDCLPRLGSLQPPPGTPSGPSSFPPVKGSCPRHVGPISADAIDDTLLQHFPLGPQRAVAPVTPPSISFNVPSVHWVLEGTDVVITCSATGKPPPDISCLSYPGPGGSSNETGQVTLTLHSVTVDQSGAYRCKAENSAGTALAWVHLLVYTAAECPPGVIPPPPDCTPPPSVHRE